MTHIHPQALVDKQAQLGENVSVGPFSIVENNTVIGDGTHIASSALIASGARIGKDCQIHHGAVVGTIPQDLKFGGEETTLVIGDRTVIREYCDLNRGTNSRGKSVVGSDCLLMAYVHVAHDCIVGNHVIIANGVQLGGHVEIEEWTILGGMTPVHQFCRVGQHAMVGGHFRVVQDVPPYIMTSGEPLRFGGLNSIGLRRRGFSKESISLLKKAYRLLYRSNLNVSQAVERIKQELEITPEINNVLNFIKKSERGLIG